MKHIIRYSLVLLLLLCGSRMAAQESQPVTAEESNILSIGNVSGSLGSQVALPIQLNNTCNDIVAAQFRLTLSAGLTINTESVQFGVRTSNHSAVVQKNGSSYVVMVLSNDNSAIAGNAGQLMTIGLNIGNDLTPGGDYTVTLSEVLLSNKAGENVMTSFNSGTLHIADVPDFVVTDVQTMTAGTVAPGSTISVAWTVKNQGGLASSGGWSEQVSLVGSGRTVLLGTVYHDEPLSVGATVSRQADLIIPALPGIDGQAKVQVKLLPHADSGEYTSQQANNTTLSTETVTLSKQLTLTVPQSASEGDKTIRCQLARSGSWQKSQTFGISAEGDSRLSVATSITIPSGQSSVTFNLTINDDNLLNANSHFTIQASGDGYDNVTANIEIEDNEYPSLTLTASKTDVTEGETFQLTVERNSTAAEPLTVMLTCEDSKHFNFPTLVTIPAGESSTTVSVQAIDDNDVYDLMSLAFVASSEQYTSAEAVVILADNDMPELQLKLTPESVSENAGSNAIIGVLRRVGNLDSKVTVQLSDGGNNLLTFSQQTLTLNKGEQEVKFGVGVTDDLVVNGEREVTLTAAVYVSSCNCYSSDQKAGSVSQTITILDNDGPTLLVSPSASVFLEGSDGNSLTISRNAFFDTPLTVTIRSDYESVLHYEHTAVIAAGQTSVTIPISVDGNNEQGDDHAFTFTVTAQGFTQGTCWSMVSDQSLPDATIANFTVSTSEAEAEGNVDLSVTVKNMGNSLLRKETPISVYLDADAVLQLSTNKILMPGEETTIESVYTLPAKTGDFNLMAVVNPSKRISELLYTNNSSASVPITVVPCLTATAQADKDIYQQAEAIVISGKATGTKGANAKLEIYLINDDTRQTITATTDANGNYTVNWTPLKGQAGHFLLGACYPGEGKNEAMDEFDVYGISLSGFRTTCQFGEGDTYTGRIYLTNPGVLPQTNIHVEPQTTSDNCEFTFTELEQLEGGKSATITYTIKGNGITPGYSWQQMPLVIKSNEGSKADYKILYYVESQHGRLRAKSSYIKTTVTMGKTREYPFTIQNVGKGETGAITLSLPNWIQPVTPRRMPSLASDSSTTIILRFVPTKDMRVNVPVTGHFGINCANGSGMSVGFEITPVSELKGTLTVDVVDEFTYYTTEAPHVSNAKVQLKSMSTGTIVAEGVTNESGKFTANMDEGWYKMTVEADNHESVTQEVLVDPGKDNQEEVYISYDAITYEWNVVETTVDDEYSIETVVKFDTRVPEPVVIVSWPKERPEPGSIFPVTVTNKGLINAKDVTVDLKITGNYKMEFLNEPSTEILAPQQSVVYYAKVKLKNVNSRKKIHPGVLVDCFEVDGEVHFKYDCGPNSKVRYLEKIQSWGHCPNNKRNDGAYSGSYGSGWGGPWHSSWDDYGYGYKQPAPAPKVICQEKDEEEEKEEEEIPDDAPEENDNCEDKPIFVYVMAPFGTIKPTTSIPADGKTYKIYLNPNISKVPSADCNYVCEGWTISNDSYGKLGNYNSYYHIYYTAPMGLPDGAGESVMVNVTMTYRDENGQVHQEPFTFRLNRQDLKFNLQAIDANGKNLGGNWRGVAADGVSKLMIKLDDDCKFQQHTNYYYHWSVEPGGLGKIQEGTENLLEGAVFVPPTDYPDSEHGGEYTVKVCLEYGPVGVELTKKDLDIVVARVPVVLLHGFASNSTVWEPFRKVLKLFHYEDYQIENTGYAGTSCKRFDVNKRVAKEKIDKVINKYKSKEHKIFVSKADIVAHSMGGILSRMYIHSDGYQHDIHKLITLNTPHSGSVIGDLVVNVPFVQWLINTSHPFGITSTDAPSDLAVNSDAIRSLNNSANLSKEHGIPVHAVSSVIEESKWVQFATWIIAMHKDNPKIETAQEGLDLFGDMFGLKFTNANLILQAIKYARNIGFSGDVMSELVESDAIVPLRSQRGGLSGDGFDIPRNNNTIEDSFSKVWHTKMQSNLEVMNHLTDVLLAPTSSGYFSQSGFNPPDLSFPVTNNDLNMPQEARGIMKSGAGLSSQGFSIAEQDLRLQSSIIGDSLYVSFSHGTEVHDQLVVVNFGDSTYTSTANPSMFPIPATFEGTASVGVLCQLSENEFVTDKTTIVINQSRSHPIEIVSEESIISVVGEEGIPPYIIARWEDGNEKYVTPNSVVSRHGLVAFDGQSLHAIKSGTDILTFTYKGLTCTCPITVYGIDEDDEEETNSVCGGEVSLKIEQRAVMTRQAFRGTLTVKNGHPTKPITDLKLNVEVRDANGTLATAREFQIEPESLNGFVGEKQFDAGWSLSSKENGTATILFIPTKYAAPTKSQEWSFGGSFSYTDPYTDLTVTRDLNPVTLTVNPTPILDFTYFMQRDILGDDPLTEPIEPMEAAEFAIIVNNKGYGSTQNMKMTTNQPQIVDNEKNLAVNFEIISTQMNGQEKTLALGQSMTTDFGTIAPQSQAYAQWWLQSTLQGHFVDYNIKATHVTSHNNPDLSLLDQVTIHELIRGFTPVGINGSPAAGRAYLVNDVEDSKDLPDEVYFTNATQQHVAVVNNLTINKLSETSYELNVVPVEAGWNYGSLADPTNGRAILKEIVRQSDGVKLPVDNIWQTDRTLRDGKDPLYEYRLHVVGEMGTEGDTYVLTFEPKPEVELAVESITGLPDEGVVLTTPLEEIQVRFNKPIDESTFTVDDLTLTCQANRVSAGGIVITKIDDTTFSLNLKEAVLDDGFYVLTIQTADITDAEGFKGAVGTQIMWTQYSGLPMLKVNVSPVAAGTVNPGSGRYDYESEVTMTATPAEGYTFAGWKKNDETLSTESTLTYRLMGNTELTALFSPKRYDVEVTYDASQGLVENGGTGIYPYGSELCLVAVPAANYAFQGWSVDGKTIASETLTLTVTGGHKVKAVFVRIASTNDDYILGDANGDGKVDFEDAKCIMNYLVGKEPQYFIMKAADMNKNGQIDIGDAVTIVNSLNGNN